ncbi:18497_t:CDS:2 [Racocetra persica]|uniref:18497_t:CDS:1 n=1 Tax=Racocetra persica TaxID=160502 RepID=A0ACA9KYX0_9GLOM|nr:18497_t:CDS:2 [Racocetra persica]
MVSEVKDCAKIIIDAGLTIAQAIPVASNIAASIDIVIEKIEKNSSNKALCKFIDGHLRHAKLILESGYDYDIVIKDIDAFTRYYNVLTEIEKRIEILTGGNAKIKAWAITKKFMNAKADTHKNVVEIGNNVKEIKKSVVDAKVRVEGVVEIKEDVTKINKSVDKIHNDIYLLAMKLDIDGWKTDIMLNNKILEQDYQEQVVRGQAVKKKYLTQDVAQRPFNSRDSISLKIVNMLKLLSNCENVIKFFGIYKSRGQEYMILEWCEHGNLEEYLLRNPEVDWNVKIKIAKGIANGLVFCHDREILHHDIKSSNILLDAHLCTKLSNFDLSRKKNDVTNSRILSIDDVRYMAPEKLNDSKYYYTKECDIYSFGIVMWVIAIQQIPYTDMNSIGEIDNYVLNKNRPAPIDEHIPNKYMQIMKKSWDHDNSNRLTAFQIYEGLFKCLGDDDSSSTSISKELDSVDRKVDSPSDTHGVKFDENKVKEMYKLAVNNHKNKIYDEAFITFSMLASEYKHKESIFYLGYYYDNGYAVSTDKKKALEYYRDSADAGCNDAIFYYAHNCLKISREYMEKSAKLGIFKSGIKLAEIILPELRDAPSQDTCNKLLIFLNNDMTTLSGKRKKYPQKIDEWNACEKKIDELRSEIQQIADSCKTG